MAAGLIGVGMVHTGQRVNAPLVKPRCQFPVPILEKRPFKPIPLFHSVSFEHWLARSEEHTSELQSLMRISYAVFCLTKKKTESYSRQELTTHAEWIAVISHDLYT